MSEPIPQAQPHTDLERQAGDTAIVTSVWQTLQAEHVIATELRGGVNVVMLITDETKPTTINKELERALNLNLPLADVESLITNCQQLDFVLIDVDANNKLHRILLANPVEIRPHAITIEAEYLNTSGTYPLQINVKPVAIDTVSYSLCRFWQVQAGNVNFTAPLTNDLGRSLRMGAFMAARAINHYNTRPQSTNPQNAWGQYIRSAAALFTQAFIGYALALPEDDAEYRDKNGVEMVLSAAACCHILSRFTGPKAAQKLNAALNFYQTGGENPIEEFFRIFQNDLALAQAKFCRSQLRQQAELMLTALQTDNSRAEALAAMQARKLPDLSVTDIVLTSWYVAGRWANAHSKSLPQGEERPFFIDLLTATYNQLGLPTEDARTICLSSIRASQKMAEDAKAGR